MNSLVGQRILIVDQDRQYARLLASILASSKANKHQISFAFRPQDLDQALLAIDEFDLIILEKGFPLTSFQEDELKLAPILYKDRKSLIHRKGVLVPGMKTQEVLHIVNQALDQAAPAGISNKPLLMVHAFSPRLRHQWIQALISQEQRHGRPLFYFPFIASYNLSLPIDFSTGPELSSLLLLLSSGAQADYRGFGPCFEQQKSGYYAVRLGGHAEDLILASQDVQEEILRLFKKFIRSRSEPSLGLVEIGDIAMQDLSRLARLADVFVGHIPQGHDFASRAGQREIQQIINSLPPHVRFQELDPYRLGPSPGLARTRPDGLKPATRPLDNRRVHFRQSSIFPTKPKTSRRQAR